MATIRLSDYCCQCGEALVIQEQVTLNDLVISRRGKNVLRFSPLGNQPGHPKLALVGITPGSQSEEFGRLLRRHPVHLAAKRAAFARGQVQIKELLSANGFAAHLGLRLTGDLNDNPDIFTTSLVKCCLMVDGSYKYKAPDVCASPEATHCVSTRFVADVESFQSLRWAVIFGEAGWDAVNLIRKNGQSLRQYLEGKGVRLLNFPHFAQNFQQRAIFCLAPSDDEEFFRKKPGYLKYAKTAQRLRAAVLEALR